MGQITTLDLPRKGFTSTQHADQDHQVWKFDRVDGPKQWTLTANGKSAEELDGITCAIAAPTELDLKSLGLNFFGQVIGAMLEKPTSTQEWLQINLPKWTPTELKEGGLLFRLQRTGAQASTLTITPHDAR